MKFLSVMNIVLLGNIQVDKKQKTIVQVWFSTIKYSSKS